MEEQIRELLRRYNAGQCTAEEKKWIEDWYGQTLESHSSLPEDVTAIKTLKAQTREALFERRRSFVQPVLKWMAAAAIITGVLFFAVKPVRKNETIQVLAAKNTIISLQTTKGQVKEYKLPDGTTVWLNEGSKLYYSDSFNQSIREVSIEEGEAYFDVAHDSTKPFLVHTGNTTTRVLGTAFDIRAYQYLRQVQVSVMRGKVNVSSKENRVHQQMATIDLLPGEQVTTDSSASELKKVMVNTGDFTLWRQGILQFNNETFYTIARILEHRFGVKSRFTNNDILSQRLTAGFNAGDKLSSILDDMCLAANLNYRIEHNEIIFSPK